MNLFLRCIDAFVIVRLPELPPWVVDRVYGIEVNVVYRNPRGRYGTLFCFCSFDVCIFSILFVYVPPFLLPSLFYIEYIRLFYPRYAYHVTTPGS